MDSDVTPAASTPAQSVSIAEQEPATRASSQLHGAGPPPTLPPGVGRSASAAFTLATGAASFGSTSHAGMLEHSVMPDDGNSMRGMNTSMLTDPDYEVPRGTMTETQVFLKVWQAGKCDRYGFRPSAPDPSPSAPSTSGRQNASTGPESDLEPWRQDRRVAKWKRMLGPGGARLPQYMKDKFGKLKRRVRKGVPQQYRGMVWHILSGGRALMSRSAPGTYQSLLQSDIRTDDETAIMRDLNRTFPNNVYFTERQGPGQMALYNVLKATCVNFKQVGYVQGMSFLAATLLLHMPEEEAFWTLGAMLKGSATVPPMEGFFAQGMPLLQCSMHQWQEVLDAEVPGLAAHLKREGVEPIMYATHWFNTLYSYSIPFNFLVRLWDIYMLEGTKVVFRFGLALVKNSESQLLSCRFEKLADYLGSKGLHQLLPSSPDELLKSALKISVSSRLAQAKRSWESTQKKTQ